MEEVSKTNLFVNFSQSIVVVKVVQSLQNKIVLSKLVFLLLGGFCNKSFLGKERFFLKEIW